MAFARRAFRRASSRAAIDRRARTRRVARPPRSRRGATRRRRRRACDASKRASRPRASHTRVSYPHENILAALFAHSAWRGFGKFGNRHVTDSLFALCATDEDFEDFEDFYFYSRARGWIF